MNVEVEVDTSELTKELETFLGRGYNQRDINFQVAEILRTAVEDKFEDEGPGWPRLELSTLKRRRISSGARILQDSGHLAASIMPFATEESAGVSTNVEYAIFHLDGTKNMPARDFFDIDQDVVLEQAAELILESIARER